MACCPAAACAEPERAAACGLRSCVWRRGVAARRRRGCGGLLPCCCLRGAPEPERAAACGLRSRVRRRSVAARRRRGRGGLLPCCCLRGAPEPERAAACGLRTAVAREAARCRGEAEARARWPAAPLLPARSQCPVLASCSVQV